MVLHMSNEHTMQAIGYDVDGTMVDSEPLHVLAWQETLQDFDRTFSDLPVEFQNSMAGRKPAAIASFMVENLSLPTTPEEFLLKKQVNFMEKVKTDLRPMPGVVESVKRLGQKYKLGIGTSLDRAYVDVVLKILKIVDDFSVIVTGDEIHNGKTHPETYLTLAAKMGVDPSDLVILEDAQSGIESAKSAGCICVAIENLEALPQDTSKADITVHSLDQVTIELLEQLVK